jgi:hypothetical protein
MRFEEVYGRYLCGRLSCEEAVLGMSVSSFFRWRQRYEAGGGLADWQGVRPASAC